MAPQRTCIGCRRTRSADELVRVVRLGDGSLAMGRELPGRGAWLCGESPGCVDLAVKRKAFDRSFRSPVEGSQVEKLCNAVRSRAGPQAESGPEGPAL